MIPRASRLIATLIVFSGVLESYDGPPSERVSDVIPISDLQRPPANTSIIYLSANDVTFSELTDDSWYSVYLLAGVRLRRTKFEPWKLVTLSP